MDVTKESLKQVRDWGEQDKPIHLIHEDYDVKTILVRKSSEEWEPLDFAVSPQPCTIEMDAIESLGAYVNSPACKGEDGAIFVGENSVKCVLDWKKRTDRQIVVPFNKSDSFSQLMSIKGVLQKELWRKFTVGDIEGPRELVAQLQFLNFSVKASNDTIIDNTGLVSGSGTRSVKIQSTVGSGEVKEIDFVTDWEIEMGVYECLDTTYKIPIRIEVEEVTNGVVFSIHIKGLNGILNKARQDILKSIEGLQEVFQVYLGEGPK